MIKRHREGNFILIKAIVHKGHISNLNIYAPKKRAPICVKRKPY